MITKYVKDELIWHNFKENAKIIIVLIIFSPDLAIIIIIVTIFSLAIYKAVNFFPEKNRYLKLTNNLF